MSYIQITKSAKGEGMPNNILRIRAKSMAISPNIGERFQASRTTTPAGYEKVSLGLAFDPATKRIMLLPSPTSGFSWRNLGNSRVLTCNIPAGLRRAGAPVGDYELVDEKNLEFQLAQ